MRKISISLLWDCNESCIFCAKGPAPYGVKRRMSEAEVVKLLLASRAKGCDVAAFDGGEPTLLPYLPALAGRALKAGYKEVQILTNAVALSDGKIVKVLAGCHPKARKAVQFGVSLHAHLKADSEFLTRSEGTFEKTLAGINNLHKAGFRLTLYHVITARTFRKLPDYARFVADNFPWLPGITFSLIYPTPQFGAHMELFPRIPAVVPFFDKALGVLHAAGMQANMSSCGMVPFCLFRGNERIFLRSFARDNSARAASVDTHKSEAFPFFLENFQRENKAKAAACAGCLLDPVCGGIWKVYADRYGLGELKPYKAAYFKKLPASAAVGLVDLDQGRNYPDPAAYVRIALADLRWKGVKDITLKGTEPAGLSSADIAAFAAELGCRIVPAQRGRQETGPSRAFID